MVHGKERIIELQYLVDRAIQVVEVMAIRLDANLAMGHRVYYIELMR